MTTGLEEVSKFSMHCVRRVLGAYPGIWPRFDTAVNAIEVNLSEFPDNAVALSKTLVETCCKTILSDRGKTCDDAEDFPSLFRQALNELGFFVPSHPLNQNIRSSVIKAVRGLMTTIQGLSEIRNIPGVDHGAAADWPHLLESHAIFAAATADAVVSLMLQTFLFEEAAKKPSGIEYEDSQAFNEYVDALNDEIKIFETIFRPSQVLFQMDPTAYCAYLDEFSGDQEMLRESGSEE